MVRQLCPISTAMNCPHLLTNMERYLFLDFDGVLHPNHCDPNLWFQHLPVLSDCLLDAPVVCKIVISSSWRFHHDLQALIARFPVRLQSRIGGATGDAYIGKYSRFNEIQAYLNRCQSPLTWRALDDCAWEFPNPCPELVPCDGAVGLDQSVINKITSWLRT